LPNIVSIVSDDRVRRQIEQFVGEMGNAEARVASFKTVKEFEALYFAPKPAAPAAPSPSEGAPLPEDQKPPDNVVDIRLFNTVNVVVFAIDALTEKAQTWTPALLKRLKEHNLWPENNRTRLILVKYEDDNVSKIDLLLPEIDDLVYVPLDRLIFLQKLELILNLPKNTKGSFLFSQDINQEIEVSKICKLEKFNDIGLAVRNPLPLTPGLRAKFYVQLPGEKEIIRFFAKAVRSLPHPSVPNQYLCYFTFFGVRKNEISKIRRWLSKGGHFKSLLTEDRVRFKLNPKDLMAVEMAGARKNIVLIDPAEDHLSSFVKQIKDEMDHVNITTETSYGYFVHKYIQGSKKANANPPVATRSDQIPTGVLKLKINTESKKLVSSNYTPNPEDTFFGHPAAGFKTGTADWWKFFKNEENELILQGAMDVLKEKKASVKVTSVTSPEGQDFAVKMKITPDKEEGHFLFELHPVPANELAEKLAAPPKLEGMDAMIIDSAFVPSAFNEWIEFLKTSALQKGLIKRAEDLKIILTSDREDRLDRAWLNSPHIVGFVLKPFETRQLLALLGLATDNSFTAYTFDNLGWADMAGINCHMAREMHIDTVSEYGATLMSPTPFRPGSFFFLRKLIFDHAPNQCLAARVYYCEPHPKEKGQFQLSVMYYGINDAFLKFARTWIRENYAHSKAQGAG